MPPVIFSSHIPKTGGTSVANALRTSFGDDGFLPLGPPTRYLRFRAGRPQLEELDLDERAPIRAVHGHGVEPAATLWLPEAEPDFVVVLREPLSLARSRHFHRLKSSLRQALEDTAVAREENPTATQLVRQFAGFADYGAEVSARNALSVLRRFKYVLMTETLERDFALLADDYRLSAAIGHKRPGGYTPKDASSVDVDPSHYAADIELYDLARRASGPGIRNPVGFDADAFRDSIERLHIDADRKKAHFRDEAYRDFIRNVVRNLDYLVAMERLKRGDFGRMTDPEGFAARLAERYAGSPYSDRQMARAKAKLGNYMRSCGDTAAARALLEEARKLDPSVG